MRVPPPIKRRPLLRHRDRLPLPSQDIRSSSCRGFSLRSLLELAEPFSSCATEFGRTFRRSRCSISSAARNRRPSRPPVQKRSFRLRPGLSRTLLSLCSTSVLQSGYPSRRRNLHRPLDRSPITLLPQPSPKHRRGGLLRPLMWSRPGFDRGSRSGFSRFAASSRINAFESSSRLSCSIQEARLLERSLSKRR